VKHVVTVAVQNTVRRQWHIVQQMWERQAIWVSWYQNVSILDFIEAKGDGGDGDNWNYNMCQAQVKSSPLTNQHSVFTGWMPFPSPNQQCQSTEVNTGI